MDIKIVEPPKSSSHRRRLSDNDLEQMAAAIRQRQWVSDGESASTRTCASQRARSAIAVLEKDFDLRDLRSCIEPDGNGGFMWKIGQRPD